MIVNRRRSPRLSVQCPVSFAIEDVEGTGTAFNLSEYGCAVTTSVPVPDEGYASAAITIPGQAEPIMIDLARVRWASPTAFGLEFRILRHNSRKRLLRFLALAQAA
jgi:hypothetical protein